MSLTTCSPTRAGPWWATRRSVRSSPSSRRNKTAHQRSAANTKNSSLAAATPTSRLVPSFCPMVYEFFACLHTDDLDLSPSFCVVRHVSYVFWSFDADFQWPIESLGRPWRIFTDPDALRQV
jgi:hypothetical protein